MQEIEMKHCAVDISRRKAQLISTSSHYISMLLNIKLLAHEMIMYETCDDQ